MDPPRDGDDLRPTTVVEDMAARLGLSTEVRSPAQLMQQLGLEQRVIDMHDDLPPGIDEPSLPALPGFGYRQTNQYDAPPSDYRAPPPAEEYQQPSYDSQSYQPPAGYEGGYEGGYEAEYDPQSYEARTRQRQRPPDMRLSPALAPLSIDSIDEEHPPSFDASEAAEAVGVQARSTGGPSDLPPGYFGAPSGGPPAYS
ncbi:hypothetical protein A1Q1_05292 [Trichosporon asahii var. asahii CBS 2479]|uniref:Uncharacterized protein n=1 Tax=Trichosporon asahii var. asahii (strain ATCC 90039 / CBS 2479 / JCM 2466 / KCTC 7840 / NBRC 103889/ NCYC 2677 / UAMH 7654) TaxID=1186058 RepID=J4U7C4_TRIAS|nr:hypothetical protein A1Q1_05292 [Trichosporon asahii var. asahii CBS 2479]EJT46190.1 hypothetical protein A1Q1_05292 [Trichosporon asahii var. asahii CBS 2479]